MHRLAVNPVDDIAREVGFVLEQPPHVNIPRVMVLATEQSV